MHLSRQSPGYAPAASRQAGGGVAKVCVLNIRIAPLESPLGYSANRLAQQFLLLEFAATGGTLAQSTFGALGSLVLAAVFRSLDFSASSAELCGLLTSGGGKFLAAADGSLVHFALGAFFGIGLAAVFRSLDLATSETNFDAANLACVHRAFA